MSSEANNQRIMIFGSDGQVGQALRCAEKPQSWDVGYFTRKECDITNPAALRSCIQNFNPDAVINASGMTHVDECEKNEALTHKINFHAVAQMAAQCSTLDIPLIHISTDYVFDGRESTPYVENDLLNPINIYGASKMMAEEALRHEHPFHVILRTSFVFSAYATNVLTRTLNLIKQHDVLRFVTDITCAPTQATAIANTLIEMTRQILNGKVDGYGTFHYCGQPGVTRYDFTKAVIEMAEPYLEHKPILKEALRKDFNTPAKRPSYTLMNCEKIERIYGIKQPNWKEGLREALAALFDKKMEDVI